MGHKLGDRIKVLREEMDISQEDLAKILKIDRASTVCQKFLRLQLRESAEFLAK
jgi:transcriptional regulator with XRE-family HTH domain